MRRDSSFSRAKSLLMTNEICLSWSSGRESRGRSGVAVGKGGEMLLNLVLVSLMMWMILDWLSCGSGEARLWEGEKMVC